MLVLLALIGVPLWLIALALVGLFWNQRRVKKTPNIFGCKARVASGEVRGLKPKFPRRSHYARWVHDVLIVRAGPGLVPAYVFPVSGLAGPLHAVDPAEVKRLGDRPHLLALRLDDGAVIEVAVPETAASRLLGPFAGESAVPAPRAEVTASANAPGRADGARTSGLVPRDP